MGDGRWRCQCGAGEHGPHDDACTPCKVCRGLGYHFVPSNPKYATDPTATCRACNGWGRIYDSEAFYA